MVKLLFYSFLFVFVMPSFSFGNQLKVSIEKESISQSNLNRFLKNFHQNPRYWMNQKIQKQDLEGNPVNFQIEGKKEELWKEKVSFRENLMSSQYLGNKAAVEPHDRARDLVDNAEALISNIDGLNELGKSHFLERIPWTDTYWPTRNGGLAYRYADRRAPNKAPWDTHFGFYERNPASLYIEAGRVDLLSPAEKYDLLLENEEFTLTQYNWEVGRRRVQRNGNVAYWEGVCHGTANAAIMMPWPKYPVTLNSVNNKHRIVFYPSDLKALGSLLWSHDRHETRFVGGRCNVRKPKVDENGRVIAPECFDTNPGTWHVSLINQIAVSKRSFIIDSTYDLEVWNSPVVGYEFEYFNPQTYKMVESINDGIIPLQLYSKDKFKKYRNPAAVNVVGVVMNVYYMGIVNPSHSREDQHPRKSIVKAKYHYDLELDSEGNIIGGEWYTNKHPDFLWSPVKGTRALAEYDHLIQGEWDANKTGLPQEWLQSAINSSRYGHPSSHIVNELFRLAKAQARRPEPQPNPNPRPDPDPNPNPRPEPRPNPRPNPSPNSLFYKECRRGTHYERTKTIKIVRRAVGGRTCLESYKRLKRLTRLDVRGEFLGGNIKDLSPLAEFTQLQVLDLSRHKIRDLRPLMGMVNLRKINLYKNKIRDVRPLTALKSLTWLNLRKNKIIDYRPLKKMRNLKTLLK